jgi:hypothetical protein
MSFCLSTALRFATDDRVCTREVERVDWDLPRGDLSGKAKALMSRLRLAAAAAAAPWSLPFSDSSVLSSSAATVAALSLSSFLLLVLVTRVDDCWGSSA